MDLALLRDVDHGVTEHARLAAQAPLRLESLDPLVFPLRLAERGEMARRGGDFQLGKLARRERDLAATANCPPAAYRIDVDAQLARRGDHRGADRKLAAPARRH